MSSTSTRQTVVVPIELGPASNFNRDIFPLSSYQKRDALGKGDFLLDATLDEMLKIVSMGTDPKQWEEVIASTKSRYDLLKLQQGKLEERTKKKTPLETLNFVKTISDYRAVKLFLDAANTLYQETRTRSEQMRRTINRGLLSAVPQEDVQPAGDNLPADAIISGLAVSLDGPLDDASERSIQGAVNTLNSLANPFADNPLTDPAGSVVESVLRDWDASSVATGPSAASEDASNAASQSCSPSSRGSVNYYIFHNSIISPNSTVSRATLNQGGSRNSGSG